MTLGEFALLFGAGVGAGVFGSTAGLASLASYPALLLVGLPPVVANVTNTVGLLGSSVGAVAGSRRELRGQWTILRRLLPVAVAGGLVGAVLLLVGPPDAFAHIVPYLVAAASLLLILSPRIRTAVLVRRVRRSAGRPDAAGARPDGAGMRPDGGALVVLLVFLTGIYGGYFGAAAGVVVLAVLLSLTDRSLPVANALKNVLLGCANGIAAVVFVITADVAWAAVPALFLGCVLGGRIGPALVRRIPPTLLRWVIGLAGLVLAVQLWLD